MNKRRVRTKHTSSIEYRPIEIGDIPRSKYLTDKEPYKRPMGKYERVIKEFLESKYDAIEIMTNRCIIQKQSFKIQKKEKGYDIKIIERKGRLFLVMPR